MTALFTGLALLRFPVGIPASQPGAPSPLVVVLAWIGAVYVALFAMVVAFVVVSEVAEWVRGWRGKPRAAEAVSRSRRVSSSPIVSTEPDPIETYQPPVITPPRVFLHTEGELPVPLNPLGRSAADMRQRS